MSKVTGEDSAVEVVQILGHIRLLMIASLLKQGVTQADIAALLDMSAGKMSGMLPSGNRSFRPRGAS